ncbi:MAG TPA: serine hydrolase domain-containing protein [Bryobacteraceae bacterium]|jgi:CubicO group peptidase (beta-lactamase class C family)|nr:serine hydrolase domain-containing protein [Bryobacteraceae bacterium]
MISRRNFLSALAIPAASRAFGATTAGRTRSIQDGLETLIAANEIPGVVTLVASRTGITHFAAQGHADVHQRVPMRKDFIFAIASMSKPITGSAVMMLQDEGKLSIEDPVAKFIPQLGELKLADGRPATITLKHMMTHTSGMGEATPQESEAAKKLEDLMEAFASKPVAFPPGSAWKYCQSGINSLCRVVEVVSGMTFPEFLERRLFAPIGMKSTTFYPTERQLPRLVTPCQQEAHPSATPQQVANRLVEVTTDHFQKEYILRRDRPALGNGGLYSTAEDYSLFARMMLNGGEWKGRRYLSAAAVKQMTSIQTGDLKAGFLPGSGWGLTVGIVREPQGVTAMLSPGTFGHGGAYGTQAWIDPVKGVALILMIQRVGLKNSDDSDMRRVFQEAAMS